MKMPKRRLAVNDSDWYEMLYKHVYPDIREKMLLKQALEANEQRMVDALDQYGYDVGVTNAEIREAAKRGEVD